MLRTIGIGLLMLALTATASIAASPHFVDGPSFSAAGGALGCTGKLAGLGNQDVTIVLTASATTTCTNRGSNVPPGLTETLTGTVSSLRPENGTVTFHVTTGRATNPCPDGMKPITTFTRATLIVIQGGRTVFEGTFTP